MIFVTIAANNYLGKAIYLAQTAKQYHPDVTMVLCVIEREIPDQLYAYAEFDEIVRSDSIGVPDHPGFVFRHTVTEYATSIKARLLAWLLERHGGKDKIVYLDPDIQVCAPFVEADAALDQCDILVTPHLLVPADFSYMIAALRVGVFNLGFLGVRRGPAVDAFLGWWMHVLERMCYIDVAGGLFVDQKWMNLAPCLFPVTVLREPGYNIAYWNTSRRRVSEVDGVLVVGDRPVRFVHFARVDYGHDLRTFRREDPSGEGIILRLRRNYKATTTERQRSIQVSDDWSYDRYHTGERISPEARSAVRQRRELLDACQDPFAQSNEFFIAQLS